MKTISLIFSLALFILVPSVSNAQFGALRKAISKQIDHKVDSTLDKNAQDRRDSSAREENQQNASGDASSKGNSGPKRGLFGGKIDMKYKDDYSFTGRIYMQMETYDKKEVNKSDYYTYYNSGELNAGIEVKLIDEKDPNKTVPTVFLFDHDNGCLMILIQDTDSKTGIISAIPSDSVIAAQAKAHKTESAQPVITKTGNSRTIAGYKCDEYKVTDPEKDGYSLVWMTKDIDLKADKRYWGKAGMPSYYNYPGFEGSVMLAVASFDKDQNPEMKMETREINNNFSHSISTAGYTFMKVNFGQAGKTGKK